MNDVGENMNIEITSRNFTPSLELKYFIKNKLMKLLTYDSNINFIKVVLLKESRAEKVELILTSKKKKYITKCYSSVFEKTIIKAINNIKIQIRKNLTHKTKILEKEEQEFDKFPSLAKTKRAIEKSFFNERGLLCFYFW